MIFKSVGAFFVGIFVTIGGWFGHASAPSAPVQLDEKNVATTFDTKTGVATSGWETYRDEKYGFELKYPDTWEGSVENNMLLIRPKNMCPVAGTDCAGLSVSVDANPEGLSAKEFYGSNVQVNYFANSNDEYRSRTIDGKVAYELTPYITEAGEKDLIVDLGRGFLVVHDSILDEAVYERIVASIEFTR